MLCTQGVSAVIRACRLRVMRVVFCSCRSVLLHPITGSPDHPILFSYFTRSPDHEITRFLGICASSRIGNEMRLRPVCPLFSSPLFKQNPKHHPLPQVVPITKSPDHPILPLFLAVYPRHIREIRVRFWFCSCLNQQPESYNRNR
jgi:hypothetical protein